MDELRKPLFLLAVALIFVAVLVEIGASFGIGAVEPNPAQMRKSIAAIDPDVDVNKTMADLNSGSRGDAPPGLGIPYLALIDGLILFTVGLMGVSLFVPARVHGRVQGLATFIFALLMAIAAIVLIFIAIQMLLTMVGLFVAAPFGTIAYMAIWGFFDRGGAVVLLAFILFLKLAFAVCLVLAQQRFLESKGLVLIILTSLLATVVVSFLHGFVPIILVSITDAVGALIAAILAVIWAIFFLFGSIASVVKALRVGRASA